MTTKSTRPLLSLGPILQILLVSAAISGVCGTVDWAYLPKTGTDQPATTGVFGADGQEDPLLHPPGVTLRPSATVYSTDGHTYYYQFGGLVGSAQWDTLWRFNLTSQNWAQITGSNTTGTHPAGLPPQRHGAVLAHRRGTNSLILFGGYSWADTGYLNDLWEYTIDTNTWVELKAGVKNTAGIGFSQPGQFDLTYRPGSRVDHNGGMDDLNDIFYVFGGYGYGNTTLSGQMNDVWAYQFGAGWAFITGSYTPDSSGNYNESAGAMLPACRRNSAFVLLRDYSSFLIFGGQSGGSATGTIMDGWLFRFSNHTWQYLFGSNEQTDYYTGTYGNESTIITPGGRAFHGVFEDGQGYIWLSLGTRDSGALSTAVSDVWAFDPDKPKEWFLIHNSSDTNPAYSTSVTPGRRRCENQLYDILTDTGYWFCNQGVPSIQYADIFYVPNLISYLPSRTPVAEPGSSPIEAPVAPPVEVPTSPPAEPPTVNTPVVIECPLPIPTPERFFACDNPTGRWISTGNVAIEPNETLSIEQPTAIIGDVTIPEEAKVVVKNVMQVEGNVIVESVQAFTFDFSQIEDLLNQVSVSLKREPTSAMVVSGNITISSPISIVLSSSQVDQIGTTVLGTSNKTVSLVTANNIEWKQQSLLHEVIQSDGDEQSCEETSVEGSRPTSNGRTQLNVLISVDSTPCNQWWVITVPVVGGVLIVGVILAIVLSFKCKKIGKVTLPYRDTEL